MQKIIRNINSTQFGLSVQDAILNGYLVTKSFGKPSVGYMAVMSQDKKAQLAQGEQKIDYQLNLNLRDTNPLHFALKLQQAILGGYRIKPDLRFGKFGVVWYASLEIGKSQLGELLKQQSEYEKIGNLEFKSFGNPTEIKGAENSYTELDGVFVGESDAKGVDQTEEPKQTSAEVKTAPKKRTTKTTQTKQAK